MQHLKEAANQFVYNLAKQDLAFFYHQTISDIDHVRAECWKLYHSDSSYDIAFLANNRKVTTKDRLQALRTILQADLARFELLSQGEMVMCVKAMEERLVNIEGGKPIIE